MESKMRRKNYLKDFLWILIILTGIIFISYTTMYETFAPPTFGPDNGTPIIMDPDLVWIPSLIFMVVLVLGVAIAYAINSRNLLYAPQKDFKKRPNVAISYSRNNLSPSLTRNSKDILSKIQNSHRLNQIINEEKFDNSTELTILTEDIIKKIEKINWEDEDQKTQFLVEILALTPEEREDIIDYMLEKSMEG